MTIRTRARFKLQSITDFGTTCKKYTFYVDTNNQKGIPEDQQFSKYTPSGMIEISIQNPIVNAMFDESIGKTFYVDIEPENE